MGGLVLPHGESLQGLAQPAPNELKQEIRTSALTQKWIGFKLALQVSGTTRTVTAGLSRQDAAKSQFVFNHPAGAVYLHHSGTT